jgi:predicted CXXCH cytochrome family protein
MNATTRIARESKEKGGDYMRRLWLIVPALLPVVLLLVMAISTDTASADNGVHIKGWGATPNDCAACHRAHRGQAPLLLVQEQAALCEGCHGNDAMGSSLNVLAGTNEADGGALRGGGFETARINTTDPSLSPAPRTITALPEASAEPTASKHNVGSIQTVWGYGAVNAASDPGLASFELECGKCHDPHGSGNYRILRTVPSGTWSTRSAAPAFATKMWVDSDNDGILDTGEASLLADENPKTYSTTDYWPVENYTDRWVDATSPADTVDTETTGRQVGKWCSTCHTRYLAPTGSYETDSGDAIFAYRHTTDPSTRHASSLNSPVTLSGSCLKCHVSHGSNATVGGFAADEETPDSVNPPGSNTNDSRLLRMDGRGICQKCHNK